MRGPSRSENPYASPAADSREPASRTISRNRIAFIAFLLTLAPPLLAAFAPLAWLFAPEWEVVIHVLRWLLFLSSPAAVFAATLGIIAVQGRQSGYALAALLIGGVESLLIVVLLVLL